MSAEEGPLLADGFEAAFIGIGTQFNTRLAIYDYEACVEILMERDGLTEDDAHEWMSFNVCGAWVGEQTPVFVHRGSLEAFREQLQNGQ